MIFYNGEENVKIYFTFQLENCQETMGIQNTHRHAIKDILRNKSRLGKYY